MHLLPKLKERSVIGSEDTVALIIKIVTVIYKKFFILRYWIDLFNSDKFGKKTDQNLQKYIDTIELEIYITEIY